MAMAFDEEDDVNNELRNYLENATGAWLYVVDHLMRNDARGGYFPEGNEYSPQSLSYILQFFLLCIQRGKTILRFGAIKSYWRIIHFGMILCPHFCIL